MDMSEKIYQDLMKLGNVSRQTNSKRTTSANATSAKSYHIASQYSSAKSKTSRGLFQGSYTDFDIMKSKSWIGSKGRGNEFPFNCSFHRTDKRIQSKQSSESRSLHSQTSGRDLVNNHSISSLRGKGHSQLTNNRWPGNSSQVNRLRQEWAALDHCRAIKRASEMVQHRLDPMYCLSGSNVPLLERYHIDEAELENLRQLSAAGHFQLAESKRKLFPNPPRTVTPGKIVGPNGSRGCSSGVLQEASKTPSSDGQTDSEVKATLAAGQPNVGLDLDVGQPSSPVCTPDDTPRAAGHNAAGTAGGADEEINHKLVEDGDYIEGDST